MSWEHTPQRVYETGYAGEPEGAFTQGYARPGLEERPADASEAVRMPSREYTSYQEPAYGGQVMQPVQPPPAPQGYVLYGWQPPFTRVGESSNARVAGVLSYLGGWFSGLVLLFFGYQNKYVRFHALQSLLFFGFINLADIVMFMTGGLGWRLFGYVRYVSGFYGLAIFGAFMLLNALAFIGWVVCMAMAGSGKTYKLPFFGHLAARFAGLETPVSPMVK